MTGCTPSEQWIEKFQQRMSWLKSLLNNTREEFREVASQMFGIVAATFNTSRYNIIGCFESVSKLLM